MTSRDDPYLDLLAAVLLQAVQDARSRNVGRQRDAIDFLEGQNAGFLLTVFGIDAAAAVEALSSQDLP